MIEFQCIRCIELFSLRLQLGCLPLFESEYSHSNKRRKCSFLLVLPCWPCAVTWSPTRAGSGRPEPPLKWVCSSLAFPQPVVDFDQILSLSKFLIWLEFLLGCSLRYGATINFFPGGCPVFPKPRIEPAVFSSMICDATVLADHILRCIWICFWTFGFPRSICPCDSLTQLPLLFIVEALWQYVLYIW